MNETNPNNSEPQSGRPDDYSKQEIDALTLQAERDFPNDPDGFLRVVVIKSYRQAGENPDLNTIDRSVARLKEQMEEAVEEGLDIAQTFIDQAEEIMASTDAIMRGEVPPPLGKFQPHPMAIPYVLVENAKVDACTRLEEFKEAQKENAGNLQEKPSYQRGNRKPPQSEIKPSSGD